MVKLTDGAKKVKSYLIFKQKYYLCNSYRDLCTKIVTMHYFKIRFQIVILLAIVFSACNNDIFVDSVSVPKEEITLDGNRGSQEFKITKKGLMDVKFDNDIDYRTYQTYYDKEGQRINQVSNIDEISKIVYNSDRFAIELQISGNNVVTTALDNTYEGDINVWADLIYKDQTKTINFIITPGAPMEVTEIFQGLSPLSETKISTSTTKLLRNNTSESLKFSIYPFRDVSSTVNFTFEDEYRDINATVEIDLPLYMDGEWKNFTFNNFVDVNLAYHTNYYAFGTDIEKVEYIEVPAYSTAVAQINMTFAIMDEDCTIVCQMPNSEISHLAHGKFSISQPIDYKIDVKCEEL